MILRSLVDEQILWIAEELLQFQAFASPQVITSEGHTGVSSIAECGVVYFVTFTMFPNGNYKGQQFASFLLS